MKLQLDKKWARSGTIICAPYDILLFHFSSTPMDYAVDTNNEQTINMLLEEFSNRIYNQLENVNSIIGTYG